MEGDMFLICSYLGIFISVVVVKLMFGVETRKTTHSETIEALAWYNSKTLLEPPHAETKLMCAQRRFRSA